MTVATAPTSHVAVSAAARPDEPRLLPADRRLGPDLATHLRLHGPVRWPDGAHGVDAVQRWADGLIGELELSGLCGRGGGGFPSFAKLRAARALALRPILVVNAMEGEPASGKDHHLIATAPHLVLDGAVLAARLLDSSTIEICVPSDRDRTAAAIEAAIGERTGLGERARIAVRPLPGRYVGGEESALVSGVTGRGGLPSFRPDKSVPLTIGRRTVLVHNVETLATMALVARHGGAWYRSVGAPEAPGTRLVTVSGAVERPGVLEIETGTPVASILAAARPVGPLQAVLVGGYGGSFIRGRDIAVPFAPLALRALGASPGAGVLVALGTGSCGLRETERIARFMAAESAGQCGPCLFGLPAIADDLGRLATGRGDRATLERLRTRCDVVVGRGACAHPDGVVRLVRSALDVFADDLAAHARGAPCAGHARPTVLVF